MGFDLRCVFTLDARVSALYDKVLPGGSGYALRTSGAALPDGWVLPDPWELEYGLAGQLAMTPGALEPTDPTAWRAAAGIPDELDPLDAFDASDLQLGSLLSLAAPVMILDDSTFGGVLDHEYAALFVNGELVAAGGVDHDEGRAFELTSGAFRPVDAAAVDPTTRCAELLDPRFAGKLLYDGYLPRAACREGAPVREVWSGGVPPVGEQWRGHFPVLGGG